MNSSFFNHFCLNFIKIAFFFFSLIALNSHAITINENRARPFCSNDTVTFTVANTANKSNYLWSATDLFGGSILATGTGSSFTVFGNLPANGILVVELTYDSTSVGSQSYSTGFITVIEAPEVQLLSQKNLCPGISLDMVATVTGSGIYAYKWYLTPGNDLSTNISYSATGGGRYYFRAYDTGVPTCGTIKAVNVTGVNKPSVAIRTETGRTIKCFTLPLQLYSEISTPSVPPYSFSWKPSNGLAFADLNTQNPSINPTIGSEYEVKVTDANGCKDSSKIFITLNTQMFNNLSDANLTLCKFTTKTITSSASGGTITGSVPYKYVWNPTQGVSNPNISNPVITPLDSDLGINYTVTGIDAANCSATGVVNVKKAKLTLSLKDYVRDTIQVCAGTVLGLNLNRQFGSPIFTFSWSSTGTDLVRNNDSVYTTAPIRTASKFYAQVVDNNNCSDFDSLIVNIIPSPIPNLASREVTACIGSITNVNVTPLLSGAYSYKWSPDASISNTNIANPNFPASAQADIRKYTFTITDGVSGCVTKDSINVNSAAPPTFDITEPSTPVYIGTAVGISTNASSDVNLVWNILPKYSDIASSNPVFTFDSVKVYTVVAVGKNALGCSKSDTLLLKVRKFSNQTFYIPNIFAPASSDSRNSSFKIFDSNFEISDKQPFSVKIYNVLGELVYSTDSYQEMITNGWNGEGYSSGVYTYYIKGTFADETTFSKTGGVTLLR
jgi:hypothetical protein